MYIFRRLVKYISVLLIFVASILHAQNVFFVTNSNSPMATAYSNSHKIALNMGEGPNDTISVVFQSSDSVYLVSTNFCGQTWSQPTAFGQGKFPALDINALGLRHVAWQSPDGEIYYDCLDDWSPPMNVSQSVAISRMPDLVADFAGAIHVVWIEDVGGYDQIFHRAIYDGVLGDTTRVSCSILWSSMHQHIRPGLPYLRRVGML